MLKNKKIKKTLIADPLATSLSTSPIQGNVSISVKEIKRLSSIEFILLFGLMMSLTAMTISSIIPAIANMQLSLGVTDVRSMQLIVSLFILGMAFGELIFGPIADAIGRKAVVTIGIAIYIVGSVIAIYSESLTVLLIGRVIQGIGVSGPKIGSRALIRDLFKGNAMASVMSFMMMLLVLMPMLAPIFGQWIINNFDWHAIFFVYCIMAIVLWIWFVIRQEETLAESARYKINSETIGRNFKKITNHAFVMACTLIAGLTFGAHMSFVNSAQSIFQDVFKQSDNFVYYFSFMALASGIASFLNAKLVLKFGMMKLTKLAFILMLFATAVALVDQLLIAKPITFPVFMAVFTVIFFSIGFIYGNINSMGMQYCGKVAGTASSAMSSISSLITVVLSIAVGRMYAFSVTPLLCAFFFLAVIALFILRCLSKKTYKDIT